MINTLVTGANGALGRAVIAELKKQGNYRIFTTTSRENVSVDNDSTQFICDFRHPEQLTSILDLTTPDLILHLGASFTNNITEAYLLNVAPANHMLDLIERRKAHTRLILIGSAAEYGIIKPEENPINEEQTLQPVSVYGVSKAWQTQLLGLYASRNIDVVCARIFNLFGPGISERLFAGRIQKQIEELKGNRRSSINIGSLDAIRDYISIYDAAQQLLLIAEQGLSGQTYHIGSGAGISMRNFLINQLEKNSMSASVIQESPNFSNRQGFDVPVIFASMKKTNQLVCFADKIKS
ncbi:MAG: NAD-dependent epimerase/dehydratase family protein [Legionellaceae bacterium]|nr:NAD-dependent epimerase/dehydratase family protein [Legionellaceae bacterium]